MLTALDATWFGAVLAPDAQTRLAALARIDRLPAGTTVLSEGEPCASFAVVLSGRVALRMLVPERGRVTILTVETGDILGWSAVVAPYRSTSTAVTVEPSTLLVLEAERLRSALRTDHVLAAGLYPRVLAACGRRLAATRLQLLDLFAAEAREIGEPTAW